MSTVRTGGGLGGDVDGSVPASPPDEVTSVAYDASDGRTAGRSRRRSGVSHARDCSASSIAPGAELLLGERVVHDADEQHGLVAVEIQPQGVGRDDRRHAEHLGVLESGPPFQVDGTGFVPDRAGWRR
jgi:hypothetical protein